MTPSPASIAADAKLVVTSPSYVKRGKTTDGQPWIVSYVGERASIRVGTFTRCDLLTHERADELATIAPYKNSYELAMAVRR